MTINEQGRQPDGKWDTKNQSDPSGPLTGEIPDDVYNADGTFHYPVKAKSAAQAIAFWSKVDVDDESLTELQMIHLQNRDEWLRNQDAAWSEQWEAAYDTTTPAPATKVFGSNAKALENWETAKAAALDVSRRDHLGGLWDERAQVIGNSDARTVARVLGLGIYTKQLPEAERAKVLAHRVDVNQTSMTVHEAFTHFGLDGINPAKLKAGTAQKQLAEMREVYEAITHQTKRMGSRFQDLTTEIQELRRENFQIAENGR